MDPADKSLVITLHGDLGLADRDRIAGLFPNPQAAERIVIDCSDVNSMDSSILALIMTYRRRVQIAGRDPLATIVALARPRLHRLFELTGICRAITVVSVEDK
ncbi:MAG: STAS domain-containing protein [Candidatus Eremiobacteraeota bacterium]|nr:STAS domain-containing protein [Candidatus Eremiobacteraeota bacterium]